MPSMRTLRATVAAILTAALPAGDLLRRLDTSRVQDSAA
ncbi:MAG: hypothetical protein QOK30_3315 [Nocardioidaceae bacterium]|jgi:hypothetical protein|nr:hypothetical protein [Nocardioidaceae bacterium]